MQRGARAAQLATALIAGLWTTPRIPIRFAAGELPAPIPRAWSPHAQLTAIGGRRKRKRHQRRQQQQAATTANGNGAVAGASSFTSETASDLVVEYVSQRDDLADNPEFAELAAVFGHFTTAEELMGGKKASGARGDGENGEDGEDGEGAGGKKAKKASLAAGEDGEEVMGGGRAEPFEQGEEAREAPLAC